MKNYKNYNKQKRIKEGKNRLNRHTLKEEWYEYDSDAEEISIYYDDLAPSCYNNEYEYRIDLDEFLRDDSIKNEYVIDDYILDCIETNMFKHGLNEKEIEAMSYEEEKEWFSNHADEILSSHCGDYYIETFRDRAALAYENEVGYNFNDYDYTDYYGRLFDGYHKVRKNKNSNKFPNIHRISESFDTDDVEIHYTDLVISPSLRSSRKFAIDYEYTIPWENIKEFLFDAIAENDEAAEQIIENDATDEEILDYIEENKKMLIRKYFSDIKDNFRSDAEAQAQAEYNKDSANSYKKEHLIRNRIRRN